MVRMSISEQRVDPCAVELESKQIIQNITDALVTQSALVNCIHHRSLQTRRFDGWRNQSEGCQSTINSELAHFSPVEGLDLMLRP